MLLQSRMLYRSGSGGRTTGLPSVSTVACGGGAGCGGKGGAAACGGNKGGGAYCAAENAGFGLRAGAVADRGKGAAIFGAAIRGRRFVSEVLTSDAFTSVALAMSRDICSWPALSCSTLALSCSICCAIDCSVAA